jgi:hypothetical protein
LLHTAVAYLDHPYREPFFPQPAEIETFVPLVSQHADHLLDYEQQPSLPLVYPQMFAVALPALVAGSLAVLTVLVPNVLLVRVF